MHVSSKLLEQETSGRPGISFEFFPPKTAQGVQNLYDRMDRMHGLGPTFIDITWGAGGRRAELTCEMVRIAQTVFGLETVMHLTCTDMPRESVDDALEAAYKAGCTNILALRGDPPREREKWEAAEGGFRYAKDLVKYIREKYGNHFDIGVGGYPEGADDNSDVDQLIDHLKEKVDAGSSFIVTQMFYDADNFLNWVQKCRDRGINVPIIPGIMPISTYAAFIRRSNWTKSRIPPDWLETLEPVKNDDARVREIGTQLVSKMCRNLVESGKIHHLHLYALHLVSASSFAD
jgi:methylenetetrahydrofolate reductase (NADPH)